ncbi:hypothetical protein C8Q80DRAFT_825116 [Daedaleopsis nitida]|nr:hypothetical protein C8Q80DRAFT_825116 [Daedaleopsis nitida]
MSGTNNVPIGGRYDNPTSFETPAAPPPPPPPPPSFQSNDNGYDSRRQYGGDRGVEPSDSYGSRSMRFPPPSETSTLDRQRNDRAGRRPSVTTSDSMRGRGAPEPIDDRISPSTSRQSRFGPQSAHTPNASAESEDRVWFTREQTQAARGPMMRGDEDRGPRDVRDADLSRRIDLPVRRDELPPRRDEHAARQRSSPPRGNFKDRWGSNQGDESYGRLSSSASAPAMNFPRHDRPRTPPLPGDRRQEELAPVKVHPDRVRLLSAPTPVPPDVSERGGRPARDNRRPPERPREYEGGRGRDLPRDLPPKPQDARMGPPRDRSPPSQNGYRPGLKRGGSLLDRLTLHDTPPPEGVSSLRDRVDIVPQVSIESVDSLRSESMMDMDNDDSLGGDDGSRGSGGGRGMGKRRHAKPRRGRRNGAP